MIIISRIFFQLSQQYSRSLAKLRSSNPAPDPRDHAKFRKLEEAIQRALAQEAVIALQGEEREDSRVKVNLTRGDT